MLATTEVLELLQQHGLDLPSLPTPPGPAFDALLGHTGGPQLPAEGALQGLPGGSGGYLEAVFRAAAGELFGQQVPHGPLQMRVGRNAGEVADETRCWNGWWQACCGFLWLLWARCGC